MWAKGRPICHADGVHMPANHTKQKGAPRTRHPVAMHQEDARRLLGVPPSAPPDVIQRAFRVRVLQAHPDKEHLEFATSNLTIPDLVEARDTLLRGPTPRVVLPPAESPPEPSPPPVQLPPVLRQLAVALDRIATGCTRPVAIRRWIITHGERTRVTHHVKVVIPPGAPDGFEVRLQGMGPPCRDTQLPRDLVLCLETAARPPFERDPAMPCNLRTSVCVSLLDALTTDTVKVPTFVASGRTMWHSTGMPHGTGPGTIAIPGGGLPVYCAASTAPPRMGALLVRVDVHFPARIVPSVAARMAAILRPCAWQPPDMPSRLPPDVHTVRVTLAEALVGGSPVVLDTGRLRVHGVLPPFVKHHHKYAIPCMSLGGIPQMCTVVCAVQFPCTLSRTQQAQLRQLFLEPSAVTFL